MDFSNKKIVITGAASGMGRETAIALSKRGAVVVLLDRDEEMLKETYSLLSKGEHSYYVIDLLEIDKIANVIKEIVLKHGAIYGLVHCAGITSRKPLNMLKPEGFNKIMAINVYSFIELAKQISKKGNYADNASFVAISSVSSVRGYRAKAEYCVSKAALDAAIRCIALELIDKRIKVNSIMPGIVMTPMAEKTMQMNVALGNNVEDATQPLGYTFPSEVAETIMFLLDNNVRTITGTTIRIDGGMCI